MNSIVKFFKGFIGNNVVRYENVANINNKQQDINVFLSDDYPLSVAESRVWYSGDIYALKTFFASRNMLHSDNRFWSACQKSKKTVRTYHDSLYSDIIKKYVDTVSSAFLGVSLKELDEQETILLTERLKTDISKIVRELLLTGEVILKFYNDGNDLSFKVVGGDQCTVVCDNNGKEIEYHFYHDCEYDNKRYKVKEVYAYGKIFYTLDNEDNVILSKLIAKYNFSPVDLNENVILACRVCLDKDSKYENHGTPLLSGKTDALDALDESVSQYMMAIRHYKPTKYIPETFFERGMNGEYYAPSDFEDNVMLMKGFGANGQSDKMSIDTPTINLDFYPNAVANAMDKVMQGVISPASLGIDIKKTDNAEAQREKEKTTIATFNGITTCLITGLKPFIKLYVELLKGVELSNVDIDIKFTEFLESSWKDNIEKIGLAKDKGLMSLEMCLMLMYGDKLTSADFNKELSLLLDNKGVEQNG